ncbi:glutamate--tRNA ligase [Candidatus Parcubacteria bacterium]|nr:MAG: glutamate--tRNA ligase [Candidatus Parcubacteria bacterium]
MIVNLDLDKKINVRTRVAPSPTGYPHIGTVYQSLFDYAFAKKNSGQFIVRIEDTDRKRFVEGAEEKIYEALDWFNLEEDESPRKDGLYGPYRQSERLGIYKKYAEELVGKGNAYYCFCLPQRLEEVRKIQQAEKKPLMYDKCCRNSSLLEAKKKVEQGESYTIRLKVPENQKIIVKDEIRGEIEFESNLIDDQVLIKSDGFPTYHLAVVVDDHLMEITHLVRAEEWISSSPKHILLYDFFGWEKPLFFHTADLRNPDKSKLSKRHGHTNVAWYQEEGYLPEAILNYLAHLGWSHPKEEEVFSLEEFIELFELKDLSPVGPIFDFDKLNWMNGIYIRQLTVKELSKRLKEYNHNLLKHPIEKNKDYEDEDIFERIVILSQSRISTLKDFFTLAQVFFENPKYILEDDKRSVAKALITQLKEIKDWNKDNIFLVFKNIMQDYKIRMPVLYGIVTGQEKGLPLPETLEILGKEETVKCLKSLV